MKNAMKPARALLAAAFLLLLLGTASAAGFSLRKDQSAKPFTDIRIELYDFMQLDQRDSTSWAVFNVYEGTGQITCQESSEDQGEPAILSFSLADNSYKTSTCWASAGSFTIYMLRSDINAIGASFAIELPVKYPRAMAKTIDFENQFTLYEIINGPGTSPSSTAQQPTQPSTGTPIDTTSKATDTTSAQQPTPPEVSQKQEISTFDLAQGQFVKPFSDIAVELVSASSGLFGSDARFSVYEGSGQITCQENPNDADPEAVASFSLLGSIFSAGRDVFSNSLCYASAGQFYLEVSRGKISNGKAQFYVRMTVGGKTVIVSSPTGKTLAEFLRGQAEAQAQPQPTGTTTQPTAGTTQQPPTSTATTTTGTGAKTTAPTTAGAQTTGAQTMGVALNSYSPSKDINLSSFTVLEVSFTPTYDIRQYTVEIWKWKGENLTIGSRKQVASCKSPTACPELVANPNNYKANNKMAVKLDSARDSAFKSAVEAIAMELASDPSLTYCVRVETSSKDSPSSRDDWADTECKDLAFKPVQAQQPSGGEEKPKPEPAKPEETVVTGPEGKPVPVPQSIATECTVLECLASIDRYRLITILKGEEQKAFTPTGAQETKPTGTEDKTAKAGTQEAAAGQQQAATTGTGNQTAGQAAQQPSALPAQKTESASFSLKEGQFTKPFSNIAVELVSSSSGWLSSEARFSVYEGTGKIYCKDSDGDKDWDAVIGFGFLSGFNVSSFFNPTVGMNTPILTRDISFSSQCFAGAGSFYLNIPRDSVQEGSALIRVYVPVQGKNSEVLAPTGKTLAAFMGK